MKKEKSKDIMAREEDAHEKEIALDPEAVIHRVRASRKMAFVEIILSGIIGFGIGLAAFYYLYEQRRFGTYFSYYNFPILLNALLAGPPLLFMIFRFKTWYKRMATKFEISRRFIRSELFVGANIVETCDMTKVQDVSILKLGPVSNITILTKDKTTPVIKMEFIATEQAKTVAGFITSHAQNTYVEMRTSRKNNRL